MNDKVLDNNELRELNKDQKWYYRQIMKLGKEKRVRGISYDELFAVLDRVKFAYILSLLDSQGLIIKRPSIVLNRMKATKRAKL